MVSLLLLLLGDPHFKKWDSERTTFHGECDLVLIHSEQFHNRAGFDLHARTTIDAFYSYIEAAALRVGDNTLELENEQFYMNGVKLAYTDLPMTIGPEGDYQYTVSLQTNDNHVKEILVDLNGHSHILFKFYKHFLTFTLSGAAEDFGDSVGLLGQYGTGDMYSRAGEPIQSFDAYGFEWQVNPKTDGQLFRKARAPQLPYESCRLPTAARPSRRALRSDNVLHQQAQVACAQVENGHDFELCVDDIMMTGDVGLALAW